MEELAGGETWRVFRIMSEFVEGFEAHEANRSGRLHLRQRAHAQGRRPYKCAMKVGRGLAGSGFAVITGGGPGHHGGRQPGRARGGASASACNIDLPRSSSRTPTRP